MTKRIKNFVFLLSLAAVAMLCLLLEKEGEGSEAVMAGALLVFAILNWVLETAPIAITALSLIVLVPFTGLMTFQEAVKASFGNSVFGFFLGVLLLSYAFRDTGLGRAISKAIFSLFGRKPSNIVLGVMTCGAFLAMWITEVAAAAVIFPIAMSIWDKTKGRSDHAAFGKAIMLGVAWGCAFGGVATPIATGANLIAVEYLQSSCGVNISFAQWMRIGVPICLSLLAAGWMLLTFTLRDGAEIELDEEALVFGPREKKLAAVFVCAVVLWIGGCRLGITCHHVALLAAVALFLPGMEVMEWKRAVSNISWESIMLIASGVMLGDLLFETGVAQWMADLMFAPQLFEGGIFLRGVMIVLAVSVLKVLFSSNTVSGIVLVPIMISLAQANGLSPWGVVAPCIFSSALSLVVISSSPVNVIPYASKAFTPKDMACYGVVMTVITAVIIGFWLMMLGVN